jgi:phosphonate transport system substrate-binding protein
LAIAVGISIDSARRMAAARDSRDETAAVTVRTMGLVDVTPRKLAAGFTDASGRLLADPPAASNQLVDPPKIVLAHIQSSSEDAASFSWPAFEAYLSKAIGREVTDAPFENGPDEMPRVKAGEFTLLALHSADAPYLVNNFGYQPIAILGDDSGATGNRLDIIVPTDSPLKSLGDLRDQSVTCTVPSSITGYRAAIALLMENAGLRPNVDYTVTWSTGQRRSISGIADKELTVAAVSDDKLKSMTSAGDVSASSYRTLFSSGVIPRLTIGYFYNLKPELADKIKSAILAYRPTETAPVKLSKAAKKAAQADDADAMEAADTAAGDAPAAPMHFLPADYKKDFELVRQIDDRFDPRFNAQLKAKASTATTEPSTN